MRAALVVLGLLALVGAAVLALLAVVLGPQDGVAWVDLEPGDCFDLAGAVADAGDDALFRVEPTRCNEPHDAEIVATGRLDADGSRNYPSDDELFDLTDRQCERLVGDTLDEAVYGLLPVAPDERTWSERGGHFACVAVVRGGGTVTVSAVD